jgi:hypothetical protein
VIIAVITVQMVQVSIDQVVNMVAMRHGLVPTSGTVHVPRVMPAAPVLRCAALWIGR